MIAGNDVRLRNEEAPMGNLDTRDRTEPELISIREAARMVGFSNRTMNRLCLEGKVKAVRIASDASGGLTARRSGRALGCSSHGLRVHGGRPGRLHEALVDRPEGAGPVRRERQGVGVPGRPHALPG